MRELIQLAQAHPAATALLAYAIFASAVGAMKKPGPANGEVYRYLYRFLHLLAFNIRHALKAKFPAYVPEQKA